MRNHPSKIKLRQHLPRYLSQKFLSCRLLSVEDIQKVALLLSRGEWVFRGQYSATWPLKNLLERKYGAKGISWKSEHNAINEFKNKTQLLMSYGNSLISTLATMQHYGVPTRLLDFTRAFFVAVYFAFENSSAKRIYKNHAVWAVNLNHVIDNSRSIRDNVEEETYEIMGKLQSQKLEEEESFERLFLDELKLDCFVRAEKIRERAENILSHEGNNHTGILPIDLSGCNPRMAAQNGLFIMTTDFSSFENSLGNALGVNDITAIQSVRLKELETCIMSADCLSLVKFTISEKLHYEVDQLLKAANINHQTLFPDLSGIASQIKYK